MSRALPDRRTALAALGGAAAGGLAARAALGTEDIRPRGNIKQSICRWCYGKISLDKLCQVAKKIGYQSIELLAPGDVKTVKDAGLTCAVLGTPDIANGLNRTANHDKIVKQLTEWIDVAAAHRLPNVICMSGNRNKMGDEEGLKNCTAGLKRVVGHAEKKGVTIIMEGLNSRVNHKDYMYDRTAWGVDLCKRVGSERFKLLYDIYHMQIMEGDIIRTIRQAGAHIAHYHTGGCPGRNEIDETQELNYPAIVRAIVASGYRGYLGQEFIPRRDPVASLTQAYRLCDVG